MVTMWSVNTRPKPGLVSRAARSAAETGDGFGRLSKSTLMRFSVKGSRRDWEKNLPRTVVQRGGTVTDPLQTAGPARVHENGSADPWCEEVNDGGGAIRLVRGSASP